MGVEAIRRAAGRARALSLQPERHFWLIVGLIILVGLALRLLVHDFGLPWFEEIDELRIWFTGRIARGMPVVVGDKYNPDLYPPLIIWLHRLWQPIAEAQGRPLAVDTVLDLRRLMLVFNALGMVWFAMLGRRCGGPLAGILAVVLWAFDANVLEVMIYAIGESLVIPLLVLSALLAAKALDSPRRWWLAPASMALGLFCFLGEYRLVVAVVPGLAALLWLAWDRYRPGWRLIGLLGVAGLALASVAGAAILQRLPERFQVHAQETLGTYLWDIHGLLLILEESTWLIHGLTLPLVLLLTLLVLRARHVSPSASLSVAALLVVIAQMVLTAWANSSIRPYGPDAGSHIWSRHLLPTSLMLLLLLATVVAQLLSAVQQARARHWLQTLLPACLLLLLLPQTLSLVQNYRVLPWPVIVRNWVDNNLESSKILVYDPVDRWFNPVTSSMPQRVWFDWWKTDDIRDKPLQEWIDDYHITWALIPLDEHQRLTNNEPGRAMVDQMLLLRDFSGPEPRRGARTLLYRLWRMQHETDVRFGEHIRLSGYDLHSPDPQPGPDTFAPSASHWNLRRFQHKPLRGSTGASSSQEVEVTLYWNATTTPSANHSFFLHLVGIDDPRPLAQVDGNPAIPARPTKTWDRPEETLISPRLSLPLPDDLPPGDYRVLLGLYNFETGERLPLRDTSDAPLGDAWELLRLNLTDSGTVVVTEASRATR